MAEAKITKKRKNLVFKVGGNYASGDRFEAGDAVPSDLTAKELEAFIALDAVEEEGE